MNTRDRIDLWLIVLVCLGVIVWCVRYENEVKLMDYRNKAKELELMESGLYKPCLRKGVSR